jgi:PAS domain S-box-containing protein
METLATPDNDAAESGIYEALRQNLPLIDALLNTPTDIILLVDAQRRVLFANQTFYQRSGKRPEEVCGRTMFDILPPGLAEKRDAALRQVLETGATIRFEDQGVDGWLDSTVFPIRDQNGQIVCAIAYAHDITDRKRLENDLRKSHATIDALLDTPTDIIILLDRQGEVLTANKTFYQRFDLPEKTPGVNLKDILPPKLAQERIAILQHVFESGEIVRYEDAGATGWFDNSVFPILDSQDKVAYVAVVARDITEHKRIQQELVQAHANLEQRVIERTAELRAINRQLSNEIALRKQAEDLWRRHALHSEALARVASKANAHLELNTILETICAEIIRALSYPISSIILYDEKDDCLHLAAYASTIAVDASKIPPTPREYYEAYLSQAGPLIVIPDASTIPLFSAVTNATVPNIRTVVSLPLYDEEGLFGALNLASVDEIRLPGDDELNLLHTIADQAALSIINARLFKRVSDSQARLKALTERLVEVQENEKRRLARELHDEIGQLLTSLSLNLEIAYRAVQANHSKTEVQSHLERIREQTKQLLEQVRDLSLNLLPSVLDDLGLLPALMDHCQRFTAQTGIQVNLTHRGLEQRVSENLEIVAYRIIQEALDNVARYASVKKVDVRLWATPAVLGLQVEDQGTGFDLTQIEKDHWPGGIAWMRERAANFGGYLEIEAAPGKGTCLTVEFPLDHHLPGETP